MAAAFQSNAKGRTPMIRVYDRAGRAYRRSLGTTERPELAPSVEAYTKALRGKRWDVLEAIIAHALTPYEAFLADVDGTLAEKLVSARQVSALAAEVDLSPLVDSLVDDPKYRKQIRRMIPAGTKFGVSGFTTKAIAEFLRGLTSGRSTVADRPVSGATRNRYKAALSCFASRLIEHGVIERNPVRDIQGSKRPTRQIRFLEPEQVKALVDALPMPFRALEALLAGTGMEIGAALRLTRRDVDDRTRIVFAKGTKNQYRTRYVAVSESWAWDVFWQFAKGKTPSALLFDGINYGKALRAHNAAAEAVKIPPTVIHTHRHSYAVMHLQEGSDHQWLKNQLGHAPQSTLIFTTYGVWINAAKLTKGQLERLGKTDPIVTTSVTTAEK